MTVQQRGTLRVDIDFPAGTSRDRLMEVLADALYKADVVLSDPMPTETHDREVIKYDDVGFSYVSSVSHDHDDSSSDNRDDDSNDDDADTTYAHTETTKDDR